MFSFGGLLGGAGSGAAAGSAFGPIGTGIGAGLGALAGAFGGGSTPRYQPSELQQSLMDYGEKQVKAPRAVRDAIISEYEMLQRGGNRGAAEAYLSSYINRYSNSKPFAKRLAQSYQQDIDFTKGGYWNTANELYRQQGLGFSPEDFGGFVDRAKALGIRSPQAFGDMLKQQMVASGKVMTPQQEQVSMMWGDPYRDESGRYTNYYRTPNVRLTPYTPPPLF